MLKLLGIFLLGWATLPSLHAQKTYGHVQGVESQPKLEAWAKPIYPPELKAARTTGNVTVYFRVTATGEITDARIHKTTDERFNPAALDALQKWKFSPALIDGQPTPMAMRVLVKFILPEPDYRERPPFDQWPTPQPKTTAEEKTRSEAVYPEFLIDRGLEAGLDVEFVVNPDGKVGARKLLGCTDSRFIPALMLAMDQWSFTPATEGDTPIDEKKRSTHFFYAQLTDPAQTTPDALLALNGFAFAPEEGRTSAFYCDRLPKLVKMVDPVFPEAKALAGESAEITLEFTLNKNGLPERIHSPSGTETDWARSALAALCCCEFEPALIQGTPVDLPMTFRWKFNPPPVVTTPNTTPTEKLLSRLQTGAKPISAKNLDAPLKPLWVAGAKYPPELTGQPSRIPVKVTCIIDPEGRVLLPSFSEAPTSEIGWAAVTAASQCVFNRPTQKGAPTDVRIALTIVVEQKTPALSSISR